MKIKRLIAMLLSLVLVFGFVMPVFAQESVTEHSEATKNPATPVITVQPQSITIRPGDEVILVVEAYIPNGDLMRYHRWFSLGPIPGFILDTNTPALDITEIFAEGHSQTTAMFGRVRVAVYNAYDESLFVHSEWATITMEIDPPCPAWLDLPIIRWIVRVIDLWIVRVIDFIIALFN